MVVVQMSVPLEEMPSVVLKESPVITQLTSPVFSVLGEVAPPLQTILRRLLILLLPPNPPAPTTPNAPPTSVSMDVVQDAPRTSIAP